MALNKLSDIPLDMYERTALVVAAGSLVLCAKVIEVSADVTSLPLVVGSATLLGVSALAGTLGQEHREAREKSIVGSE